MTDPTPTRAEVEAISGRLEAADKCIVELMQSIQTLRDRAEAAEADQDRLRDAYIDAQVSCGEALIEIEELQKELTEARAQAALAWQAAYAAGLDQGQKPCACHDCIALAIPPADLSAALTARLDAEWNAAIEAAGNLESIHGYSNAVPRHRIRALRRAAPTEGEA